MKLPPSFAALLVFLPAVALAQSADTDTGVGLPTLQGTITPDVAPQPAATTVPGAQPATLPGVTAALAVPRPASGPIGGTGAGSTGSSSIGGSSTGGSRVSLSLSLKSTLAQAVDLQLARDNAQDCAFAPQVRVLRVGTREVVYPAAGASPKLCAQDIQKAALAAGGTLNFGRDLDLPAGEYMVESWWKGLAGGVTVKIPAQPVRITVK